MAIYSLHHQPIGKSTQARPHTSAAHVRYITRPSAASRIEAHRMPEKPRDAQAFMVEAENRDRKNGRVADKILLALPGELNAEQRAELVRGYADEVTQRRAPWIAAFHDQGKDAHNPHAHLMIRDRDPDTGRRVAGLSERGSTERLRALWEKHANFALEKAGHPERIDRRTLKAQGIGRQPTVHEGPRAQQMERRGARPKSRLRQVRNRPGSRLPHREVDYRGIDRGRSRPAYNREIRETPGEYWAALDASDRADELEALRAIHHPPVSVDVERTFRALPQLPDKLVGLGAQRGGFSGTPLPFAAPRLVPRVEFGFMSRPAPAQPVSDNRHLQHERPEHLFREEVQPKGNPREHILNIGAVSGNGKGNSMDDSEKILARHRDDVADREFENNKSQSLLKSTMERAFYDPEAAKAKMDEYARQKNSREALYEKLKDKEQVFGRRPGSLLSPDYLKAGSKEKRRDADIARHNLPLVLRDADKSWEALERAKRAQKDALDRFGPKGGPGGGVSEGQVPGGGKGVEIASGGGGAMPHNPEPRRGAEYAEPSMGTDADRQNNEARRQMQEKLVREQHPAFAPPSPAHAADPVVSDKDAARRRMMDQMRDRQMREKELEKQKSKGKGFGIGE